MSAASPSTDATTAGEGGPDITWPLERPSDSAPFGPRVEAELRKRSADISDNLASKDDSPAELMVSMKELLPGHKRAQSGISLQAFFLGQAFGVSALLTVYALYQGSRLWRPPFFMICLSLFHFLEFWTHAKYNLPNATISAFLLFDNGVAYQIAHGSAMVETIVTSIFFPEWQAKFSIPSVQRTAVFLIILGQLVRSMAIAKAGTNFNHKIQHKKKAEHELVTDGIYGVLRHPSYFGFFWWAVGTQIALGNVVCTVGYALVLWRFFSRRIRMEEKHLVEFFGKDYLFYRTYTRIAIPGISSVDYPDPAATTAEKKTE